MAGRHILPPWDYLHEASVPSLESFELSRLNHAANLRKEIAALLEEWIEETATALLAHWVREDRKLRPSPDAPLDILPHAELPCPPQSAGVASHHTDRRLRPRRPSSAA